MPAELLREVLRAPDRSTRARSLWVLPLSITAHAAIAMIAVIIPIAADGDLPTPAPLPAPPYVKAQPLPPPPARAAAAISHPLDRATAVPIDAPSSIAPERPAESSGPPLPGLPDGVDGFAGNIPVGLVTPVESPILSPAPAPPPTIVRPGGVVREPKLTVAGIPVDPALARSAHVEGPVILEAIISEAGIVEQVKVLKSIPLLDIAAVTAVRQWRYTPTLLNGKPVSVLMTITVRFTLNN